MTVAIYHFVQQLVDFAACSQFVLPLFAGEFQQCVSHFRHFMCGACNAPHACALGIIQRSVFL